MFGQECKSGLSYECQSGGQSNYVEFISQRCASHFVKFESDLFLFCFVAIRTECTQSFIRQKENGEWNR